MFKTQGSGKRIFFLIRYQLVIIVLAVLVPGMIMACQRVPSPSGLAEAAGWQKMPLLSPAQHDAGISPGGEGGQWFRDIVISKSNPDFLVLAIDVGGLYRSLDGGFNWENCNVGWHARGANAVAIDPRNHNRVLAVGGNSRDWDPAWRGNSPHGVYLSTNAAASWQQVLQRYEGEGAAPFASGGFVAWDESSFNATAGHCMVAYYIGRENGFFRTDDGGHTWNKLPHDFRRAWVRVDPNSGAVYVAGDQGDATGLLRSEDGGQSFTRLIAGPVHGFDLQHGQLWVSGEFGVKVTMIGVTNFQSLALNGVNHGNKPVRNIMVSPADPDYMGAWVQGDHWNWRRYISHDGGANWSAPSWDNSMAFLPYNVREGHWAWHPTDRDAVFTAVDWVARSTDGGKTFQWYSNGYNGIMVGGGFNFSQHQPTTVLLSFQDYNGAFTVDGGTIWHYTNISGHGWGGFCYGGFALDSQVMWAGDSDSWGGPRRLRVSRDGGETWPVARDSGNNEIIFGGADVSYADPRNADVLFASNWRSTDRGLTWHAMSGCDGIYTFNPLGNRELVGRSGNYIVVSHDSGATWKQVASIPGGFRDVAIDHRDGSYWVASEDRLKKVLPNGQIEEVETPRHQLGGTRWQTVAVDPSNPGLIYVGGSTGIFMSNATVARSTDGGRTWENLTETGPLSDTVSAGPREVSWLRVHPLTREVWAAGSCFGMWRLPILPRT
jgi:photosystem II stability/assembly factor-like uncharacterized protein